MQFYNQTFITTRRFKAKNPALLLDGHEPFQGKLRSTFDFGNQTKNFNLLKAQLKLVNIQPVDVYSNKCQNDFLVFVVTFTDPNVIWIRTKGSNYGYGKNQIVLNTCRINLSSFLTWSPEEVTSHFASANGTTLIAQNEDRAEDEENNEI